MFSCARQNLFDASEDAWHQKNLPLHQANPQSSMVMIGIYPLFMLCVDAVMPDAIGHLFALPDLGAWGLWGLFVGTFLAATVVPFSSDVLYVAMLQMTASPWACLAVATAGNWLGSLSSFGLGWLGKWEWLEKWFKVDRAKLEKQKVYVDRYGVWLALVSWLPFVGDLFSIALGFYKTNPWLTALLMLLGKFLRFLFWNLLLGVF